MQEGDRQRLQRGDAFVRFDPVTAAGKAWEFLCDGIGDTIRVSLSADPVEEVKVAFDILKSLRIRSRGINFIACPSCSRQEFDVIKTMNELEQRLEDVIDPLTVSVIGCVVNGPGEALISDLGVAGANRKSGFYLKGERQKLRIDNESVAEQLEQQVRLYLAQQKQLIDIKQVE